VFLSFPDPKEQNNGFIYAKVFGGFANIRSSVLSIRCAEVLFYLFYFEVIPISFAI